MMQAEMDLSVDQIQRNFERFHKANPRVWMLWCRFANEMIYAGCRHGSAKLIAERIRWETSVVTTSNPPVKLNNNYTSRYARRWMLCNPDRAHFFRTRALAANSADSVVGAARAYGGR